MEETREDKIAELQAKRAEMESLKLRKNELSQELIAKAKKEEVPVQ